jgi:hypothetical protein
LPEDKGGTAERNQRLAHIRAALREVQEQTNLGASKITIRAKGMRLTEVLKKLQTQSGNVVTDLREQEGTEVTNPSLDLEIVDLSFFEALDQIAAKAELTPNFYTSDGSIGLMAGKPMAKALVQYAGPFRITFRQFGVVRDFQAEKPTANAQFEVAWEPRLRPMLLSLKSDQMKIVDDQGKTVEPQVEMESTDVGLHPDNPVVELNVNLVAPDRAARKLATLKVRADVTVPAGLRHFRFPSLVQKDVAKSEGDVRVTFEDAEVDEQVWKVHLALDFPGQGPAFESFRQGQMNNRIWLQKADGSRFEHNGGFSSNPGGDGKLGFEYLFVDVPGKMRDYSLVYETPSKVLPIPLEFEFKDVPLP